MTPSLIAFRSRAAHARSLASLGVLMAWQMGSAASVEARAEPDGQELFSSQRVVHVDTFCSQDRIRPGDQFQIALQLAIEPGWHINAHDPGIEEFIPTAVTFEASPDVRVGTIAYPSPRRKQFAFTSETLKVYDGTILIVAQVAASIALKPADALALNGTLTVQACNETTCLVPSRIPFSFSVPVATAQEPVVLLHSELFSQPVSPTPSAGNWLQHMLEHRARWVWFVAVFLGGLALNLTPCVYPMIPVTLAFFGSQAVGRVGQTALLALLYVVGIAVTYAALGVVAAQTGALFGSWLQHPMALLGIAALIVGLALGMFGLYELRLPRWLTQRFGQASTGRWGALVMGLTVGVMAAPCIGPFVLGLLVFVGQRADPVLGFLLFLTMGLGMGLPYLFLGIVATRVVRWPKAGAWLMWVKQLLGVALLGLALYFVKPLMSPSVFQWVVAAGLILAGAYLGWVERHQVAGRLVWIKRAVGLILAGAAVAWLFVRSQPPPSASIPWQPYREAILEDARQSGRPVIIDVYADWCLPCLEMDHTTFHHPEVVRRLSEFVTLRIDATLDVPPEAQALFDRYHVYGVPTVLLFDANGQEQSGLRILGPMTPEEFLERLAQLNQ